MATKKVRNADDPATIGDLTELAEGLRDALIKKGDNNPDDKPKKTGFGAASWWFGEDDDSDDK